LVAFAVTSFDALGFAIQAPASASAAACSASVVVVSVVSVVVIAALSSPGSRNCATSLPAPAVKAAPAKKSVVKARLAASRRGARRILRRLFGSIASTASAAAVNASATVLFEKRCLPCGISCSSPCRAPRPVDADLRCFRGRKRIAPRIGGPCAGGSHPNRGSALQIPKPGDPADFPAEPMIVGD
jgi:hypothetical protein